MPVSYMPIVYETDAGDAASPIRLERRCGKNGPMWAITRGYSTLNTDGEWEYEPSPSNRDDDYLSRNRFTFEVAKELLEKYVKCEN